MVAIHRKWRRGGYHLITNADDKGRPHERDTFTCRHCSKIVEVPPFADATTFGRWCHQCGGLLCARCSVPRECARVVARQRREDHRREFMKALAA